MKKSEVKRIALVEQVNEVKIRLNITDRQREIFDYIYKKGYSLQKIADTMYLTLEVVKSDSADISRKLGRL